LTLEPNWSIDVAAATAKTASGSCVLYPQTLVQCDDNYKNSIKTVIKLLINLIVLSMISVNIYLFHKMNKRQQYGL